MLDDTLLPTIAPLCCALEISRLRLLIIKIKKSGERGNPYLMPLETRKKLEGVPLTSTTKFEDSTQPIIQLTPTTDTPIYRRTSLRKFQFTQLKALTRSNLSTKTFFFSNFMECSTS